MTDPEDHVEIEVAVRDVTRLTGSGRLFALATIDLDVAGVAITLFGVRAVRHANGGTGIGLPQHRVEGRWTPSIQLPDPVCVAIVDEMFAALSRARLA